MARVAKMERPAKSALVQRNDVAKVPKVPKDPSKGKHSRPRLGGLDTEKCSYETTQKEQEDSSAGASWTDGWNDLRCTPLWCGEIPTGSLSLGSVGGFDVGGVGKLEQREWLKMILDTGAAVRTFSLSSSPEGTGDGRMYLTASVCTASVAQRSPASACMHTASTRVKYFVLKDSSSPRS